MRRKRLKLQLLFGIKKINIAVTKKKVKLDGRGVPGVGGVAGVPRLSADQSVAVPPIKARHRDPVFDSRPWRPHSAPVRVQVATRSGNVQSVRWPAGIGRRVDRIVPPRSYSCRPVSDGRSWLRWNDPRQIVCTLNAGKMIERRRHFRSTNFRRKFRRRFFVVVEWLRRWRWWRRRRGGGRRRRSADVLLDWAAVDRRTE